VDVAVVYGLPLPGTAERVRGSVASAIGSMTGLNVRAVDVTVTGLDRTEPGDRP
jgi:uncharacterized alkaline shock family protein YloU